VKAGRGGVEIVAARLEDDRVLAGADLARFVSERGAAIV